MSNAAMAMIWGMLFCLPAAIILAFWYWLDEKKWRHGK